MEKFDLAQYGLNAEIVNYYMCPCWNMSDDGDVLSAVHITVINENNVEITCPDIKQYAIDHKPPKMTIEMTTLNELESGSDNLNIMLVRQFCCLSQKKIEYFRTHNGGETLRAKGFYNIVGEKLDTHTTYLEKAEKYSNYEERTEKCVRENDLEEFAKLYRDLYKLSSTDKRFMWGKNINIARKAFEILRYDYLITNKLRHRNTNTERKYISWLILDKIKGFDYLKDDNLFGGLYELDDETLDTYLRIKNKYNKKDEN